LALLFFVLLKRRNANANNAADVQNNETMKSPNTSKTHWSALISRFSLVKSPHNSTDLTVSPISPPAPLFTKGTDDEQDQRLYQLDSRELDPVPNLDSSPVHELAAVERTQRGSTSSLTTDTRRRVEGRIKRNDHVMSWASQGAEKLDVGKLQGNLNR
jgi:hypothetical protein